MAIHTYGFSLVGSSHSKKKICCQDASKIIELGNGWAAAAVADGVGSCKYSDVAAKIAVDVSLRVCAEEIGSEKMTRKLTGIIEKAFTQAEKEIERRALSEKHDLSEYDTTLSLVIYSGRHITYGHCGDGGIIGLTTFGEYVKVTSQQKVDGVYVVPLRSGKDSWAFGIAEGKFASVLLATDGVYDAVFPYLLKGQPVDIYVPLVRFFMDNNFLKASKKTIEKIGSDRQDYLNSGTWESITDDKTVVVLINGRIHPKAKEDEYYAEPDWQALQMEWNKKAYPHLYKTDQATLTDRETIKETEQEVGGAQ